MRAAIIILGLAALLLAPFTERVFGQEPDDTFACLDTFTGPITRVQSDLSYGRTNNYGLASGARVDARGAVFLQELVPQIRNPYPWDLRGAAGNRVCVAGGTVHNTNPPDMARHEGYVVNNGAVLGEGASFTWDGQRVHNAHDGIRPARRNVNAFFTIRNAWISYIRDDCVENDSMASGLIEDSLFDGCYAFLSSRNGNVGNNNTVTIRNSLIRLQNLPGPKAAFSDAFGHVSLFKYQASSPGLVLENNIFLIEGLAWVKWGPSRDWSRELLGFRHANGQLKGCSNNIIVWLGPDDFPGDVPDDPSCVTVTTDRSVWDDARAQWITDHPKVGRIAGVDDPAPDPDPDPIPDPDPDPIPDPDPDPMPGDLEDRVKALEDDLAATKAALEAALDLERNRINGLTQGQIDMNATLESHGQRLDDAAAGLGGE